MTEIRGRTRIVTRSGINYLASEPIEDVRKKMVEGADEAEDTAVLIRLTTVTGQEAFPPEEMWLRADEIAALQSMSEESWVWQKQADTQHYARILAESSGDRLADTQENLLQTLKEMMGEEGGGDAQ